MLDIEAIRRATTLLRGVAAAGPGAWDGAPEEDVVDALGAAAELSRACDALRIASAGALSRRSEPLLPSESLARRLGHAGSRKLLMELFGVGSYAAQSWMDVAASIQPRRGLSSGELPPLRPAVARAIGSAEISAEVAKAIVEHLAKLTGESVMGGTDVAEAALVANATGGRINLFAPAPAEPTRLEPPRDGVPSALPGTIGSPSGPGQPSPGSPGPHRPILPPSMDDSAARRGAGSAVAGGRLGLDRIKEESRAWWLVLDPDGAEPNYARQRRNRSFRLVHRRDGGFDLSGFAPEVEGQAIKTVLDAWLSPRVKQAAPDALFGPDTPFAAADRDPADPGAWPGIGANTAGPDGVDPAPRTRDQRAFDALANILALHAASADAPSTGGAAPTLLVSTTLTALDEHLRGCAGHDDDGNHQGSEHPTNASGGGWWPSGLAHLPLDANGLPDPHALIDLRFARVGGDGTPIPLSAVLHLLCDAALQVMLTDPTGVPLKLGRAQRLFSKDQRRVLAARDRHCRAPGCDIPAPWCEVHHVVPWQDGGRTDVSNAILLCSFHHHEIDRGRLRVSHHPGVDVPFGRRYSVEPTWAPRGGRRFRPTG